MTAAVLAPSFSEAYCAIFSPWNGSMKQERKMLVRISLAGSSGSIIVTPAAVAEAVTCGMLIG